jgi:hypothetical protein
VRRRLAPWRCGRAHQLRNRAKERSVAQVIPGRFTARRDEPFVVFLIGLRVNRPLQVRKWLPAAMGPMVRELQGNPQKGFAGGPGTRERTQNTPFARCAGPHKPPLLLGPASRVPRNDVARMRKGGRRVFN